MKFSDSLMIAGFLLACAMPAFATMPAGAPRPKKQREDAIRRVEAEIKERVGQAGGENGEADESLKEKYYQEEIKKMQQRLRSTESQQPIHRRRYAPQGRQDSRGRRGGGAGYR